mmetsp:Transcript_42201/g.128032  ORF Transcript_42201/g.128032 Transcript_42201/m.128032 type:complete len:304 (-) Transcript_42201:74-985(-)
MGFREMRPPPRTLAATANKHQRHRHLVPCHAPSSLSARRCFSALANRAGDESRSSLRVSPHSQPEKHQHGCGHEMSGFRGHHRLISPFSVGTFPLSNKDSNGTKSPQFLKGPRRRCREGESRAELTENTFNALDALELSTSTRASDQAKSSRHQKPKTVAFSTVQVREYSICLGDNPACTSGPPLSVSWDYCQPRCEKDVTEYEKRRGPRLRGHQLKLPPEARRVILQRLGESDESMERVAEELSAIQIGRALTVEENESTKLTGMGLKVDNLRQFLKATFRKDMHHKGQVEENFSRKVLKVS